jgi:hypothetical protein
MVGARREYDGVAAEAGGDVPQNEALHKSDAQVEGGCLWTRRARPS